MNDDTAKWAFKQAAYAHLAEVGKALSSPARLEILALLGQAPRTVEALAQETGQSVANTSQHLQRLRRTQLVQREVDGQHRVYRLAGRDVAALVGGLHDVAHQHVAALEKLHRDFFAQRDGLEAIDRDTLLERLRDGDALLVDVRPEEEFAAGHLPGAVSIPLAQLEARLAELPMQRRIVAYCRGPLCTFSADAARRLRERGYDARRTELTVHDLPGGCA